MVLMSQCHGSEGWGVFSNTREMDFNSCFEDLVLISIPTLYILLLGTVRCATLVKRHSLPDSMTRNWLYFVKLATLALLILTSAACLLLQDTKTWKSIQWIVSLINTTAIFAFVICLHHLEYMRNRIQSSVLLFYWLIFLISGGIKLRTLLLIGKMDISALLFGVTYILAIVIFALENINRPTSQGISLDNDDSMYNAEENSSIFSRLFFAWMTPLIQKGYQKPLTAEDLRLRQDDQSHILSEQFEQDWKTELQRERPSLTRALAKVCGRKFIIAGVIKLVKDLLQYVQPLLLKQLILWVGSYLTDHPQRAELGILISGAMFLSSALQTICFHQYFQICFSTSMRVRAVLVTSIYRKTLVLNSSSRQGSTVGEIVNYMAVDTTRIMDLFPNLHHVWSAPLQITICLYLLHQIMGPSIWAGVLILLLTIPINIIIARTMRRFQKTKMKNDDMRIRMMNEILNGIKVIKLYAWEKPFMDKIGYIRNDLELSTLKKIGKMAALQSFTWASVPFLVTVATFAVYISTNQPLTSDIVFVAISLFGMLQFPLAMGPDLISGMIEASVSLTRIESYLTLEEMDPQAITHEDYRELPDWTPQTPLVEIQHGHFQWASPSTSTIDVLEEHQSTTILENINIQVKKGELMAIVGRVGAGKSSIISALLGDITKTDGEVILRGSTAYAPQQPWLLNATVRENITFGHRFDPVFYDKVLDACSLRPDLLILTDGDQTEIGERGINLSGGQKARISLARAVYSRADVYLLDDPLSAVDAHVGKHLFDKVIGPKGLLKNKSRILVTHAIAHLPLVDRIAMIRDKTIILNDTYDVLMANKTELYTLLMEYNSSSSNNQPLNGIDNDGDNISIISNSSSTQSASETRSLRRASRNEAEWTMEPAKNNIHLRGNSGKSINGDDGIAVKNLMTTEDGAKGSVDIEVYKTYISAASWWAMGVTVILQTVSQSLQVGANVWLKEWAANNDKGGLDYNVWLYLMIYALIGWSSTLFAVVQTLILRVYCAIRAAKTLHSNMLNAVLHSPMSFFDTTPLGRILNRFAKDVHTIDELIPRVFGIFFRVFPVVVATMMVIGFSTPLFLLFMVPLFLFYRHIQKQYLAASRELKRLDSIGKSPIYSHFQETITGVSTIRAYEQQDRFIYQNEWKLDSNQQAYYASMSSNRWLSLRLELLGAFVIFLAAFLSVIGVLYQTSSSSTLLPLVDGDSIDTTSFMAKMVRTAGVDPGLVGLSVSYALSVTSALTFLIRSYCEVETRIVSVERVKEYSELPNEKYKGDVSANGDWPANGCISFFDYATRYRPGLDLCLRNVSFTIRPREKIGICGRTGSGKSSLTMALFRILEAAEGSIVIDDVPIQRLGLTALRSRLSIIPQEPTLFVGTLRSNLDPLGDLDDAKLWTALENSHLRQTVEAMDGKLDTAVQEGGENFSVGQRQLICLARALLRSTSILVLDEATAAIDVETDALIQNTIRQHFRHCTVLTIAHRVHTILDSDKILLVDRGTIGEFDTPAALLEDKNSKFYSLCKEANVVPS